MSVGILRDDEKGYTCRCKRKHEWGVYVYAHWDIRLEHRCECGRINSILRGRVTKFGKPDDAPKTR